MREAVIEGAHWVVPPADGARIAIGYQGPVAPEAAAAFAELARGGARRRTAGDHQSGPAACRLARRVARTAQRRPNAPMSHIERVLAPLAPQAALVTVLDGHPATHAWLGAVRGQRVVPLGPDHFGQSGDIPDLYREYDIDHGRDPRCLRAGAVGVAADDACVPPDRGAAVLYRDSVRCACGRRDRPDQRSAAGLSEPRHADRDSRARCSVQPVAPVAGRWPEEACCRRRRRAGPPMRPNPARSAWRCSAAVSPRAAPITTASSASKCRSWRIRRCCRAWRR